MRCLPPVGDDFFYTPPAGGPSGQPGPQGPIRVAAPASAPLSGATIVAGIAALGSLLMLLGAWAPWVSVQVFGVTDHVGGLHSGLHGRYVLAFGLAAVLASAMVLTSQANLQVRNIGAGALVALGLAGLGFVIHDWGTVTDRFRDVNALVDQLGNQLGAGAPSGNPFAQLGFDGFHVAKGWGLTLSGVASAITAISGGYLFVVK